MHREHWGWDWPGEDGKEVLEVGAGRAAWLEWVGLHGVGKVQVCVYYAQILYYYCIPGFFHAIAIIPM